MGMFDQQQQNQKASDVAAGQPQQQSTERPQQSASQAGTSNLSDPLAQSHFDVFNQHILLTVQAANRLQAAMAVRGA